MWTCLVCGNEIEDFESTCLCGYERENAKEFTAAQKIKTWTCLVCGNEVEYKEKKCVCGYVRESEEAGASAAKEQSPKQASLEKNYQLLGLANNASKEEIMRSYKQLLAIWNPDSFTDDPQLRQKALTKTKELDDAYEKLILHLSEPHSNSFRTEQVKNISFKVNQTYGQSSKSAAQGGSNSYPTLGHSAPAPSTAKNKLGFGWGYFLVVVAFFQGGLAFFLGFVGGFTTDVIPNRAVALLAGLSAIGLALGLLTRRKFGLYLVYVNVVLWVFTGLFMIAQGTAVSIASGLFVIGLWVLWFRYFQRRRNCFR